MRCDEVKSIFSGSLRDKPNAETLKQIKEHLNSCAICAEEYKNAVHLRDIFKISAEGDATYPIPQEMMKQKVDSKLSEKSHWYSNLIFYKWRVVSVFFTVVLIALFTIDFNSKNPIDIAGYEVALAGIAPELVEDETICDMFYQIGLLEAAVDVLGCDTTCNLLVFDLKTQQEAQKVVNLFNRIGNQDVTTEVIPIPMGSS
ncbi:hypothetical protein ACFLQG_00245 [Candidatus Zixiibacteriota bacterium]